MPLLQSYVDGLREGDADKVASVYSETALFNDEAPSAMGMDPIVLNGRDAVRDNFAALMGGGGMDIQNVCIMEDTNKNIEVMRYDIVLGEGLAIKALGVATVKDGEIVDYQVQAAP
jgi:hypothetical protein